MTQAPDGGLSPNPRYYHLQGRAAEIARSLGSPVGGAEHLFLGMLHDGGWPLNAISAPLDFGQVEAAVLGIVNGPDYSPPKPPRFGARDGYVEPWGADVAVELGDSYLGAAHALLAMIRKRDTVPARALAQLTDLDALEAAIREAMNSRTSGPPENAVFLPEGQRMDARLRRAIVKALPEDMTFGFNITDDQRTWMDVIGPGDKVDPAVAREVLNKALASLNSAKADG